MATVDYGRGAQDAAPSVAASGPFISRRRGGVLSHRGIGEAPTGLGGIRTTRPGWDQKRGGVMKPSSRRIRRALWLSAAAAAAAALIVPAVTTSVAAQPASPAGASVRGPGYPPPKGIYQPFVNCPLNDPVMHEVMATGIGTNGGGLAACTAGNATGGSITIGNIITPVVQAV